jgi:glucose/arabinose dehydrogenase
MKKLFYLIAACSLFSHFMASCQTPPPAVLSTHVIADGLFIPWEIIYGPDNHIWFTQKNGYICRLDPGNGITDTLYHQPQTVIHGEGGMLGLALAPDFSQAPYVFVAYEYTEGGQYKEKVVRLTYDQSVLGQETTLLTGISGGQFHNGCRLLTVGDKLFITTGDATNTAFPQDLSSLNGKTLRINFDGSIPADNPIPGSPVWSWGHRNPEGITFYNGILYSSEHGPNDNDEINIIKKGRNYGWPEVHGFCDEPSEQQFCADSNVVEPLIAWTPTIAPCGIAFYHQNLFPGLKGSLLMATLKEEHLFQLRLNNAGDSIVSAEVINGIDIGRIRDICVSPEGRIFLSTSNSATDGSQHIDKIVEVIDTSANGIRDIDKKTGLLLYPNPNTGILHLTFWGPELPEKIPYLLYDLTGRKVQKGNIINHRISLSGLKKGMYFLKVPALHSIRKVVLR